MNGCSVGMTDNVTDNKPSAQWTLERRTDVANPIAINVALVGVGSGRTVVRRRFAIVGERGFVALSTLLLYKRRVHQIPMRRSPAEFAGYKAFLCIYYDELSEILKFASFFY